MEPFRPRLGVTFTHWAGRDYIVLTWEPNGKPALTMESAYPLDDSRKDRIRNAIAALLEELGLPAR